MANQKYRLVPISEVIAKEPEKAPMKKALTHAYARLGKGACVKVRLETVNHEKHPVEETWVILEEVVGGEYRGRVNNRLGRTKYHGVVFNDLLKFKKEHIVDILTQGAVGALK